MELENIFYFTILCANCVFLPSSFVLIVVGAVKFPTPANVCAATL